MKQFITFLSLLFFAISCNSAPDKALIETLASIDEFSESVSRHESSYLSYPRWKTHIFEDFSNAKAIVSEEPINRYLVENFSAIDGQCFPHNYYIYMGKDTAIDIAKLAGYHSALIEYINQLNKKLTVKEEFEENRALFKSEKKYNASIALIDESIKESIRKVLFACNKLDESK